MKKALEIIKSLPLRPFANVNLQNIANRSYLFSPQNQKDGKILNVPEGEIHRDSNMNEWFCLFCLSENVTPFRFCNPSLLVLPENFNFTTYLLGNNCADEDVVSRFEQFQAYQHLLYPPEIIANAFRPVVSRLWTVGSMVLVRGDIIHSSPEYQGYRNVGFFTIAAPSGVHRYAAHEQYTAVSVLFEILTAAKKCEVSDNTLVVLATKLGEAVVAYKDKKPWNRFQSPYKEAIESFSRNGVSSQTITNILNKKL